MFERKQAGENALIVQTRRRAGELEAAQEFRELAASAGAQVKAELWARSDTPNPRFFVGTGKADEIKEKVAELDLSLILVNHQLTPVQERNLEAHVQCRVVDRTTLILDIFSQRARSHEGKLEVELAQLRHMATRLVRGWTHLERQRGGIGNRGPGETQLELDRRLLSKRVDILSDRLEVAVKQREQGRKGRSSSGISQIALVGYTNAGKSTLFNALTKAKVHVADQLFATLDPTVRKVFLAEHGEITVADTVGFVSDLPHELVAAFRSTLTEAREAQLLLHVIDAADPLLAEHIQDVDKVLEEIGAAAIPKLLVMNKIDLIDQRPQFEPGERPRVWVSAHTGAGMAELKQALMTLLPAPRGHWANAGHDGVLINEAANSN
jgi:GTP-binding protein HflX